MERKSNKKREQERMRKIGRRKKERGVGFKKNKMHSRSCFERKEREKCILNGYE